MANMDSRTTLIAAVREWYVAQGWSPVEDLDGQLVGFRRGDRVLVPLDLSINTWLEKWVKDQMAFALKYANLNNLPEITEPEPTRRRCSVCRYFDEVVVLQGNIQLCRSCNNSYEECLRYNKETTGEQAVYESVL